MNAAPGCHCRAVLTGLFTLLLWAGSGHAGEETNRVPFKVTHVSAREAAELVAKGQIRILDVRTPKEFADGHIVGATNLDFNAKDFAGRLATVNPQEPCLIYCGSGRRSMNSLPQFEKLGFRRIYHLDGGFKAWKAAGNVVQP